jgi:hypothetical protein
LKCVDVRARDPPFGHRFQQGLGKYRARDQRGNQLAAFGGMELVVSLHQFHADGRIVGLRSTIVLDGMMTARDARAAAFAVVEIPLAPAVVDPVKPEAAKPAVDASKRGGQVAVFVSRKEKKIFVRQNFAPLFDLPIEIAQPELPLGTHVFTALELQDNGAMRWNVMSMPGGAARPAERPADNGRRGGRNREPVPVVDAGPSPTAVQALERIQMPPEAIEHLKQVEEACEDAMRILKNTLDLAPRPSLPAGLQDRTGCPNRETAGCGAACARRSTPAPFAGSD